MSEHDKTLSDIIHFHLDMGGAENDDNFDVAARDISSRYILVER